MTSGAFFSILVACSLLPFFAGFPVFMSISLIFELATARSGPRMKSPLYDAFKKAASQRPSCHPLKLNSDRIARPPLLGGCIRAGGFRLRSYLRSPINGAFFSSFFALSLPFFADFAIFVSSNFLCC
jgi:hypothetical protein